jgi:poly-gamma-glutamate biosynthesis protein PgsC/CapC
MFSELLGASAGGIVVPGYIALYLDKPLQIIGTLIISLITWGIIRIISSFTLMFGKRRMVLSILIGFILGWASRIFVFQDITVHQLQMQSIGYIIQDLLPIGLSVKVFGKRIFNGYSAILVRLA